MRIAIHKLAGSFSDRWIEYCDKYQVPYKLVNCFDSDIIGHFSDCDGLMWHWDQNDHKAVLFARQLTIALEKAGIKVFPDINTAWHHDDKVGQKYLLESLNAPVVKSYAFYSLSDALNWIDHTIFPKVFKLRGGSGSVNVRLVKSKKTAKKLVTKAFTKGFLHINRLARLTERYRIWKLNKDRSALRGLVSGFGRLVIPTELERFSPNEKGYIYFQDFIAGNDYDTRLVVVGDRCFGGRRYCRKGDFRASGSGFTDYNPALLDKIIIKSAFETAKKLHTQSVAFDYLWQNGEPKIIEISYCFPMGPVSDHCQGYWDSRLKWHDKPVNPQYFMIQDFIELIQSRFSQSTAVISSPVTPQNFNTLLVNI